MSTRLDDARLDALEADLIGVISDAITSTDRDLQVEIGPSEMGTTCERRLAYKLAQVPEVNSDPEGKWRPAVGTDVHAGQAKRFADDNAKLRREAKRHRGAGPCHAWCVGGQHLDRWLIEHKVLCGTINGREIWGTVDLYDRATATVIDWKIVGTTTLRTANRIGPSWVYETQANIYGRGMRHAGFPVSFVGIMYLPSAGTLKQRVFWADEPDFALAHKAFLRAREVDTKIENTTELAELLAGFETDNDHCAHCPWFRPGSIDLAKGCPGDASLFIDHTGDFDGLLVDE